MVRHFVKQGLVHRIFAAQGIEADLLGAQVDLGAHQPMRPAGGHREMPAQQVSASCIIRAAQEDQGFDI